MPERNKDRTQDVVTTRVHIDNGSSQTSEAPSAALSLSRRRFTKAGLLATPVLMSVVSRPVLGQQMHCLSNALSGNLSNPERGLCSQVGMTPLWWRDFASWPEEVKKGEPPSSQQNLDCETCGKNNNWKCGGDSLLDHDFGAGSDPRPMFQILCEDLDSSTGEPTSVAAVLTTAFLNATYFSGSEPRYPLTPGQVQHLWADQSTTYSAFLSHYSMTSPLGGLAGYLQTTW